MTTTMRKLGRLPNRGRPRVRLLAAHKPPGYTPPPAVDRYTAVPSVSWGMDGNDGAGDCTCADVDHELKAVQVAAGNREVASTTDEVLAAYSAITGYDPAQTQPDGSNPTDQGAEMQAVRDYWRRTGFRLDGQAHKAVLFADLDVHDTALLQWALDQIGAIGLGVNFPASAMDQFDAGEPWTVVHGSEIDGGHAVALVGYDQTWWYVLTWGQVQRVDPGWFAEYVEEAWVTLTEDFVNSVSGQDPLGGTLFDLGAQFQAITGKANPFPPAPVPPGPTPAPAPAPSPAPGPVPDAADLALVRALTPWLDEHHVAGNRRAQEAFKTWLAAKGLAA